MTERKTSIDIVQEAFESALRLPEADRRRWVFERLGGDVSLRDQVLMLLSAQQHVGDFLSAPLLDFRGQSFGPYTAESEIGRGGMSIVYKGRRSDGDFEKDVAIKVLLLQESSLSRQSETQILARLEHPNIAQLLDAGITPLGFRYLVMEHVAGKPITEYCKDKSEAEKLNIFLDVCRTIHYAHRSLVVHRDVKPDNIFVTGDGKLKLLDFGIAKLLTVDPAADNQTQGIRAFSPTYASPEQILDRPVTTATDVYSLGVLLCELLTGKPPRAMAHLPIEAMIEKVRSERMDAIPLQGDLLAIALKALRHDPAERYESAGAMARDIDRYLHRLPVEARNPTWTYVAGKLIRRHRFSMALASLAVVSLIAVATAAVVQARLANARLSAVVKLERLRMFQNPDESPGTGSRDAVGLTVRFLHGFQSEQKAGPDRLPQKLIEVGRSLHRIAAPSLSDSAANGAERRTLEIARNVAAAHPSSSSAQAFLIDSLALAATAHLNFGNVADAIPLAEEGTRLAKAAVSAAANGDAGPEEKHRLASALSIQGRVASDQQSPKRALEYFEQGLQLRQQIYDSDPHNSANQRALAESHRWLATELSLIQDLTRGLDHILKALQYDEQRYAVHPEEAYASVSTDAFYASLITQYRRQWAETTKLAERIVEVRRRVSAQQPNNPDAHAMLIGAEIRLATLLQLQERWSLAHPRVLQQGEAAEKLFRAYPKDPHVHATWINVNAELAFTHLQTGNWKEACMYADKTLSAVEKAPALVTEWVEYAVNQASGVARSCPAAGR